MQYTFINPLQVKLYGSQQSGGLIVTFEVPQGSLGIGNVPDDVQKQLDKRLSDLLKQAKKQNKTEIILYLMNGVPLRGKVLSFDNFTILLEIDKKQNLIYKHAISTLVPTMPVNYKNDE